jgi:hypothetical protein
MKFGIALIILCLTGAVWADDRPNLLLYFSPQTTQDVLVGVPPIQSVWVGRIDAAKSAAHQNLAPLFNSIAECEGTNEGDLIAKVKPKLRYNPVGSLFYAQVRIEFKLGDGRHLGSLTSDAEQPGFIDSVYAEEFAQKAFDKAMHNLAEEYKADTKLQESIRAGLATDFKRVPCGLVGLEPSR